jgi:MoaA/NifB/PqqE/SkfB family radical SAM enzyme
MVLQDSPSPRQGPAPGATSPVRLTRGFYEEHAEATGRWVSTESAVEFEPVANTRFLSFWVLSEFRDFSQELTIAAAGRGSKMTLPGGWSPGSVEVPAGCDGVRFSVNKLIPAAHHPRDPRDLAVRLRGLVLHGDREQHDQILARQQNAATNARELLSGQAVLASTPPNLGIDMYAVCNIKPPCVYCGWDTAKAMEGDFVDTPFTLDTLREWGPLFDHSTNLVNCSIGEPFMMKNIDELLDAFSYGGKNLELTTNGQVLTDTNIQKLIGRPIDLYISFDAATSDTYAVLRNRRFDAIVSNVGRLINAKGGPGRLPAVNLVFMPMRANVQELGRFVDLCADLRVDHLVLRPLNYAEKVDVTWERAGYRFEYEKELLPFDELVRTSGRAAELCRRAGVPLSDQLDFGGSLGGQFAQWYEEGRRSAAPEPVVALSAEEIVQAPPAVAAAHPPASPRPTLGAERTPACAEPWKSLYILRRGVFPCCYGSQPLAPMDQYKDVWNSPLLRDIRRDLARGRFHQYCLDSPACPIVRKSQAAHQLPLAHELRKRARRTANRLEPHWRNVVWARQWAGIRLRRIFTEPEYVRHHVRRAWHRLRG